MRAVVGFVGLEALLATVGLGFLAAVGLLARGWRAAASAAGAALLAGTAVVIVVLILLLVAGLPLTLGTVVIVGLTSAASGFAVAWRRGWAAERATPGAPVGPLWLLRGGIAATGLYLLYGAFALARAPTRSDDARIWSLKGLTLTYYDSLRPEIFHNPLTSEAHLVYPLFQPVLEAVLSRAMGAPELRLFHAELWLLVAGAIWTAGYLLWWRSSRAVRQQVGLVALAMLAVSPAVIFSTSLGFADITGSVLLGAGALALGVWIDTGGGGRLGLATLLLAAAANAKDEELIGCAVVVLAAGVALAVRGDLRRLRPWAACAALAAALILPWRIWVAAHHLSDRVTPPLAHALNPLYVLDRLPELQRTAAAMVNQALAGWPWLGAIFIVVCAVGLVTRTARRVACFYLLSLAGLVASLLWLYTTSSESLDFLIPTSMDRTVDVFMALTAFASAHILARLANQEAD